MSLPTQGKWREEGIRRMRRIRRMRKKILLPHLPHLPQPQKFLPE
jgi:hypothetical protein